MVLWIAGLAVAVLFLIGRTYQVIGTRRDMRQVPPPGRFVDANGGRLHALVLGDGNPAVVFESGIAASSLNWRALQVRVAAVSRTWTYDRPGYGWSPACKTAVSPGIASARLRHALNATGLAPPYIFVAHSYGGYIVQVFAARWPDEVAGMVLVDSIAAGDWVAPDRGQRRALVGGAAFARVGATLAAIGIVRFALARLAAGSPALGRSILGSFGTTASVTVTRIVGEVTKMPPDLLPAIRAHWSRPAPFVTMARHFNQLPAAAAEVHRALDASPPWTFPLVVMTAAACSPQQLAAQRALAARSTRGRQIIVDCGHWVHLNRPELVEDAVLDLVRLVRGETGMQRV